MGKDEEEDSACNLMKLSFCFASSKLLCEQQRRRMQHKDEEQENARTRSEALAVCSRGAPRIHCTVFLLAVA